MVRKISFLLLLIYMSVFSVAGRNITFNHLSTDDGLSQFSVNGLYIDEKGALWIGTREGLNRYDGTGIFTYKLEKNNPYSLFCNTVLRVTGNRAGKIYLLCTEGVAEFDMKTCRFTTLLQGSVHCIYYENGLYIGRGNEIYRYDEDKRNFELCYRLEDKRLQLTCMYLSGHEFWLGTGNSGVYRLNLENRDLSHVIPKGNITSIYRDAERSLWIGSWEEGVYCIKPDGTIGHFRHDPGNPESLSSNFVRACCEDNLGNMWLGTFNGLNCYDRKSGKFTNYTSQALSSAGLTHSSVWCIVKDEQGTLWLGTYFGGVNYFNPEYEIYTHYTYSPMEKKGLSYPVVGPMVEDPDGNLWIGTEGGGLNFYNRRTHEFKWFSRGKAENGLSADNIKSLYYDDRRQAVWVGTHLGGLNRLDVRTGRFTNYRMEEGNPETLPSDIVRDIIPYGEQLILATQNGVCLFNPETGKCRQLFQDTAEGRKIKMTADVTFDAEGALWMAVTGEGVFRYQFEDKTLTNFRHDPANANSLSNNNVYNIALDSHGNLWFSTSGSGLDLFRPATGDFRNYDCHKDGLIDDCVYAVQESSVSGKLLLITNGGFSLFDVHSGQFSNFSSENGFPLTGINENGLCVTGDGEVFLASTHGMISFYESELAFTPKPYKINLSRLIVNDTEVKVGDETGILQQSLDYTSEISIPAEYSMFTIEFATSNYVAANKADIVYRLEGFSDKWAVARDHHSVTYTNLSAGTYRLVIKPADAAGGPLVEPAVMTIHVLPPFYKTPWAYCLYVVVIGVLLWYLIHMYKARIKLRESLKYEQKHIQDVEALNQSKLRFFTNISHEFRTPLTLIVAEVESLLQVQNFTPIIYNKVLGVYKNCIQLRELINELLDFRKQEQGHMKIKVSRHNMVNFLYENYLLFLELAHSKQIEFKFEKEADDIEVWYDQKQMQKVVNNLLSNAFKHTPAEGTITLGIRAEGDEVVIRVADTGEGIDAGEITKIFDRFYQVELPESSHADSTGTGIGLALTKGIVELHKGTIRVESEPGKGACFIVTLRLGNEQFDKEQISLNTDNAQGQIELPKVGADALAKAELEENAPNKRLPDVKILIVEDNKALLETLKHLFEPFYHVLTAADGEEGWNKVCDEMPQIVLSDIVMPKMSGTELCKRIKNDYNTCHIPVVLLTARTNIELNVEGLRIGADDYITKPFNTNLLISRCNNLVNSRLLLQEKFSKQPLTVPQMLATNPIDKEILDRAMKIIEEHLDDENFTVNMFAREMAMARTNLFAKLKAITGQTPNEFILNVRLKKGALLLRNHPELNVTEISDRVGFTSPRYFSKCFRDVYHVNPLTYRKKEEE